MSTAYFKESWLIPKAEILDYWERKTGQIKHKANNEEQLSQEGGNSLLQNLEQYKPSRRLRMTKFFNRADRLRGMATSFNEPTAVPPPPPAPIYNDPNTARNQVNIRDILQWFPEAERYRVMSLMNYINQYLLYRFTVNSSLNIVIDKVNIANSSIVDILRYLYGLERFYVTDHKVVKDPVTHEKFGIPKGTEQFVNMLKKAQRNLKVFGFSPHRLRLLNEPAFTDDTANSSDEDDGNNGGGGDFPFFNPHGNDDDDDDDDDRGGGGTDETPFNKSNKGKKTQRRLFSQSTADDHTSSNNNWFHDPEQGYFDFPYVPPAPPVPPVLSNTPTLATARDSAIPMPPPPTPPTSSRKTPRRKKSVTFPLPAPTTDRDDNVPMDDEELNQMEAHDRMFEADLTGNVPSPHTPANPRRESLFDTPAVPPPSPGAATPVNSGRRTPLVARRRLLTPSPATPSTSGVNTPDVDLDSLASANLTNTLSNYLQNSSSSDLGQSPPFSPLTPSPANTRSGMGKTAYMSRMKQEKRERYLREKRESSQKKKDKKKKK